MSIQTDFDRMDLAKEDIKAALRFQGQDVTKEERISDLPRKVANIPVLEIPYAFDFTDGWCDGSTGWTYEVKSPPTNYSDIYKIKGGHSYAIHLGGTVGNRFRTCDVASDPTQLTSGSLPKVSFAYKKDNPPAYSFMDITYTYPGSTPSGTVTNEHSGAFYAQADGFLVIQKSNNKATGIKTYVWDLGTPVDEASVLDESLFDISNGVITLKSIVDKSLISGKKIVPDTVDGQTVTGLGDNCFDGCTDLIGLDVPSTVTSIGDYALASTAIRDFDLPSSVTTIGDYAFYNCASLISALIPSTVTTFGSNLFDACTSLRECTIQNSATSLMSTFSGCNSLTSVTLPSTVTYLNYAFYHCKSLTEMPNLPNLADIGARSFSECDNFRGQVVIPNTVTTISVDAFRGSDRITSIIIPSSVTTLNARALGYLTSIQYFEFQGTTPPTLSNTTIFENTNDCPIYVPDASVNTYKEANNWSSYASRIIGISNKPA